MKPSFTFRFALADYNKDIQSFFSNIRQIDSQQSVGSHLVCRNFQSDPHQLTLVVPNVNSDIQEIQFHVDCDDYTEILRTQVVYNFAASIKCEFTLFLVEMDKAYFLYIVIAAPDKEAFEFLNTLYDRFN